MPAMIRRALPAFALLFGATISYTEAQELRQLNAAPVRSARSICGVSVEPPIALPPRDSGPVVYKLAACFERQGRRAHDIPTLYLRDVRLEVSRPAERIWVPYDANTERVILEDFQRLWRNNALADLAVEVHDYPFSNGVIGKLVTYHITEQD
jgi:hypothetical protein